MRRKLLRSSLVLCAVLGLVWPGVASSTQQQVVYKEPRPMKDLFESPKGEAGVPVTPEKKANGRAYFYDPSGKTDPFKSFIAEQEEVQEKQKKKPQTYLETLDLTQLELIAIIVSSQGNWAMVRDAKGLGHVIQKGTALGTSSGIVYSITDKEVTIREEYKDFKGQVKFKDIPKKLPSLQ